MKRRGARVVSAGSAVLPASEPVNANSTLFTPVESTLADRTVNVEEATQPSLTIPTLNIFARFQSHRDDFDADWLLLKEDPVTGEEKPPLAAHVADKLRRHQAQLGAHRAAAAADRSAVAAAAVAPGAGKDASRRSAASTGARAVVGGLEEADDKFGSSTLKRKRRPDTYDSAEDELSQQQQQSSQPQQSVSAAAEVMVVDDANKEGEGVPVSDREDDDDGDYVPEDRKAAQYRSKKSTTPASASPLPNTVTSDEVVSTRIQTKPTNTTAEVAAESLEAVSAKAQEEEEGLTGDYLNFQSTTPTGAKALTEGALQATVHMPPATPSSPSSTNARSSPQQQQQKRHQRGNAASAADRVVVVPLWSTARMEQHGGYCRSNPLIALHQEITDLVDFLRPTEAEVTMRRFIEMELGKLVDRLWPGSRVMVYGSMYTHLLLPQSDLDMTLLNVPATPEEALTALAKEISNEGLCEGAFPQVILKTKVPLIKFAHKGSLIDVDISVGAVDGKRNSECVLRYLNTYPEALPLVMTTKYFLMQRGMHEPYHGGLGSYAATLLVVAFLRQHPIYTTNPEQRPMTGLGKLFVDFLRMCGQYWNYARVAVSLDDLQLSATGGTEQAGAEAGDFHVRRDLDWPGGSGRMQSPVSPSSPRGPMGPAQGSIADPVDAANNAASSLRLFHSVSSMFTFAYIALTGDFDCADAAAAMSGGGDNNGQLDGATPAPPPSTPSVEDLTRRPTLLSRIFHVDAGMVFHRQAIATTYARLCSEMPGYMAEVRKFHQEEDAAMLTSNARSWRVRRQQQRSGGEAPFLWETQQASRRSVTSLEERLALAHLHQGATEAVAAPDASGNPWKRGRDEGGDGAEADGKGSLRPRREERRQAASSPSTVSSSTSSKSGSGYDSDTESNASSVRVDVTRETERSRRMHRD